MATTNLALANAVTPTSGGGPSNSITGYQVTGTWTGVISFEITLDGVNWVAVAATPVAGGADVTTVTANGYWRVRSVASQGVRARLSTATTGTAVVTDFASEGAL